ncbi:ankyrin repeat domain-containing protein [Wolbachia endosymbiont (group A) of Sicus ferrugineus]|uniref:ankyrin repeat domain-containing protein n=1 Tax=Wolbachia endosymbiont (group A) of Sicus ferrugineus TaxID=2954056 RepID=UPI00222F5BB0|nr:ankyrin repeat domain-containing protein [Wolbachia endosymbiont (group A) of Sicus ferrugineus]
MTMEYEQWKRILSTVNEEGNLSKDNVIERIEKALGSRLIELSSQLSGTHDQEHDELKEKLRLWRESGFLLDYRFGSDIGTLLHIAARNNYVNIIKPLKDKGTDINIQNERGNTPLHEAVESGCKEAVQSLIENGADVNAKTEGSEDTPLHFARNAEITELLIKNGASVNEKNKHGLVPLHNAVECKVGIVGWLIKKVFSITARDEDKNTPLHNDGHTDAVRVLLQAKGIDINAANEDGLTSLHLAVTRGCTGTVKTLLQAKGINVNAEDKNGWTSLHLAVLHGYTDTVKVLLQEERIDVNAPSKERYTPLHLAALCGNTDIVEILLQTKGIDVNAEDKNGWTPLCMRLATQHTTQYITNVATEAGINVNTTDLSTFLDENSSKKIVDALMAKSANHLLKSKNGETPMDFDKNGYIRQFLEKKAIKNGLFAGCSTAVLGAAIAVALFATGTVAVELIPIVIAVVAVAIAALAVGGITYMMSKPSTKMEEAKEEKTAGDEREVPS